MLNLIKVKTPEGIVDKKREEIINALKRSSKGIKSDDIKELFADDLELLYNLYDRSFFNNWFSENYKGKLKFSVSKRMTKSAGLTLCPRNIDLISLKDLVLEIKIGIDFFLQYKSIKGSKNVCGLNTRTSLEALLIVFEHELCHVIEFILYKRSSCKNARFKAIANNLFNHMESHHRLPTYRQIAYEKLGLNIGDKVSFFYKGERIVGVIYNINKRATVMVRNSKGQFVDSKGNRYAKYYVPLDSLKVI